MKLISCEECGVVVNADRIPMDDLIRLPDGEFDFRFVSLDEKGEFKPIIKCPACDRKIFLHNGDLA